MLTYKLGSKRRWRLLLATLLVAAGCRRVPVATATENRSSAASSGVTDIALTNEVLQTGVKRFGINLGGEDYYDSGQMLKNLVYTNPGFEGETWQSILRCAGASETTCTDPDQWNQWPENFLAGATVELLTGKSKGFSGTVTSMEKADSNEQDQGVTLHFAAPPRGFDVDDFVLVKKAMPGHAEAGWTVFKSNGGGVSTERKDLSPETRGHQAVYLSAGAVGQWVSLNTYFDSLAGHSFVQMKGPYVLQFRAKGVSGNRELTVNLVRQESGHGETLFTKKITLTEGWHDYSFPFTANENGNDLGTVQLSFSAAGADVLLDDVVLQSTGRTGANPTAFRDEVVEALRALRPGILRYQDGDHLGSSFDNMIAPVSARQRAGWSERAAEQTSIPMGLPEFLELCAAVGAEPWINLPAAMSPAEAQELMQYLAGPATSAYGAKRPAAHREPWTTSFPVIHLELGNEQWNATTFAGAALNTPQAYGQRVKEVFGAAKSSPYYAPTKFDMVLGSFALIPDVTTKEMAAGGAFDSVAIAPYIFDRFDDDSSTEAIYGPMLAVPEMIDSRPGGYVAQQKSAARAVPLSVYETNIGATSGSVSQASFQRVASSAGAGLALADHMLLMLRDLGVKNQSVWSLPQFQQGIAKTGDGAGGMAPLFGAVIDMGGATNRRRPQFLVEQMMNQAMLPTMLRTRMSGDDPTWNQPKSKNDDIVLKDAHMLQVFAFADGKRRSLIVLNVSRDRALPLTFSGADMPQGNVTLRRLDAEKIDDSNEQSEQVRESRQVVKDFDPRTPFVAKPFSMNVFEWTSK